MSTVSRDTMMLTTPFHSRVEAMCDLNDWGNWMGYTTPNAYFDVELEYFAVRSTTGVFDLSPMNKYRISGPDASRYMDRLVTRDVSKIGIDRVGYAIWCNDAGQVLDDGTIFRFAENEFRLCSYQRADDWLAWNTLGFDVSVENVSESIAALAVQGPTSCTILTLLGCENLNQLKPFGMAHYTFEGHPLMVSRTGFTGDLGYEVWVPPETAEALWDRLFELGHEYLIKPFGSHALELARIEAGFLQAHIDFLPAEDVVRVGRTRSPFELGLGWLVHFSKPLFNGRSALLKEQEQGSRYRFAFLDVAGNKPAEHSFIMKDGKVVGTVTSAAWCPTAKSNLAYAQIEMPHGAVGDELVAEIYYQRELHWTQLYAPCKVIDGPIFQPARRRQTPAPPQ
jgi:aminomethyltransferase